MLRPKIFFLALRCYKNLQKKFDCQNRLVFTTNFDHNTEFTQQSTKAWNKTSPKPIFVFPTVYTCGNTIADCKIPPYRHKTHSHACGTCKQSALTNLQWWHTYHQIYCTFRGIAQSQTRNYILLVAIFCSGPRGFPIFSSMIPSRNDNLSCHWYDIMSSCQERFLNFMLK